MSQVLRHLGFSKRQVAMVGGRCIAGVLVDPRTNEPCGYFVRGGACRFEKMTPKRHVHLTTEQIKLLLEAERG